MLKNKLFMAMSMASVIGLTACGGSDGGNSGSDSSALASNNQIHVNEDELYYGSVFFNDSASVIGSDGFLVAGGTYTLASEAASGTAVMNADGTFTYNPNADFYGTDSFTYTLTTADGTATATVAVAVVNDLSDSLLDMGYEVVLSDEFDGAALDAMWNVTGNADDAVVADGNLTLSAAASSVSLKYSGDVYAGASHGQSVWVEFGATLPAGADVESVLALVPSANVFDGDDGILVVAGENLGDADADVLEAGVFFGAGQSRTNNLTNLPGVSTTYAAILADDGVTVLTPAVTIDPLEFHTYQLEINDARINVFVDLLHVMTVNTERTTWGYTLSDGVATVGDSEPFDQALAMLLELSAGDVAASLVVDYVRIYECPTEFCVTLTDEPVITSANRSQAVITTYTTDLYTDGAQDLSWASTDETWAVSVGGWNADGGEAPVVTDVDADEDTVIDYLEVVHTAANAANVAINPANPATLTGLNRAVNFELYIDSANTTVDTLDVIMSSGWPNYGVLSWNIADLTVDAWVSYSIPVQDFIDSPFMNGDVPSPVDASSVTNILQLEFADAISFRVRNVNLSCLSSEACGVEAPPVAEDGGFEGGPVTVMGGWTLIQGPEALGVGPASGDISWWSNSVGDVDLRNCLFDDVFTFAEDGSFTTEMQGSTWTEVWQGGEDSCTAPVAPHDGMGAYTYTWDEGANTLMIDGVGGFIGIPKAANDGELSDPAAAPAGLSYNILELTSTNMKVEIDVGTGFWTFNFVRVTAAPDNRPPLERSWVLAPAAAALGVGPASGDVSWWTNSVGDVDLRNCLFDDVFSFASDGAFTTEMDGSTWTEVWQGGEDSCTAPVAPHDGSGSYTYVYDEGAGTLTIDGVGGFLGIPKAANDAELGDPAAAPASLTYNVVSLNASAMTLEIDVGTGFWTFNFVAQ